MCGFLMKIKTNLLTSQLNSAFHLFVVVVVLILRNMKSDGRLHVHFPHYHVHFLELICVISVPNLLLLCFDLYATVIIA